MIWSPQQETALTRVSEWLAERRQPFFYLAGYAGTGKTTLAKHFAEDAGSVLFGSFTGKAAAVMRSKGCRDATTIHRLIYRSRGKGSARLKELQRDYMTALSFDETSKAEALRIQIAAEVRELKKPSFRLNLDSDVRHADLVIIDECSMVSGRMADDLLYFGTPVLVLGDPAQLPPVADGGFFTAGDPDYMLTEVHRQARESAILRLATNVREGRPLDYCNFPDAQVILKGDLDPDHVPSYDQVLVGRNKTRRATNARMRELLGYTDDIPQPGEKLVCLRNNHDLGLLNGETWGVLDSAALDAEQVGLTIENNDGEALHVEVWRAPFEGRDLLRWDHDREVQEFDYGYVLTAHKAQGSQWPRVIVFDESQVFRANAQSWLYTAITRASKYLTVIK